jgi:chemotaxis protein methyltransferase WspC
VSTRELEARLTERIGLDAASIGRDEIARALARRMEATGTADAAAYLARAERDADEWDELVEHVLVPETWCFREPKAFEALANHAQRVMASRPAGPLRLLSFPCASGEEPYSMAIAAIEAGIDPRRVEVLGADLSARAVAAARAGVYGDRSMRLVAPAARDRWFTDDPDGARVVEDLRRAVRVERTNLLEAGALEGAGPFDAIFCRNVLIYLSVPARRRVVAALARLLAPDGLLVTGHAEVARFVVPDFESCRIPGVLAYRRARPAGAVAAAAARASSVAPIPLRTPMASAAGSAHAVPFHKARPTRRDTTRVDPLTPPTGGPNGAEQTLVEARALADAGRLAEARNICAGVIAARPLLADAHHLLGIVALAERDLVVADAALRRVIYLAPGNHEAMDQLACVLDARGAGQEAARMRRRAGRARERRVGATT